MPLISYYWSGMSGVRSMEITNWDKWYDEAQYCENLGKINYLCPYSCHEKKQDLKSTCGSNNTKDRGTPRSHFSPSTI